jgi:anti-sigma-K factor RskA
MLVASELPRLEPDRTYQVWLRGKDGVVSAGLLRVDDRGTGYAVLDPSVPLDQFETVGISVEPVGGSPQPTGPRMLLGSL